MLESYKCCVFLLNTEGRFVCMVGLRTTRYSLEETCVVVVLRATVHHVLKLAAMSVFGFFVEFGSRDVTTSSSSLMYILIRHPYPSYANLVDGPDSTQLSHASLLKRSARMIKRRFSVGHCKNVSQNVTQ
jgi:hypothetical protein